MTDPNLLYLLVNVYEHNNFVYESTYLRTVIVLRVNYTAQIVSCYWPYLPYCIDKKN